MENTNKSDADRIILIDKPADISSFGVVARVRRKLRDEFGRKVKVGHTGTLDPFATGLLILLSGKMTKKSNEFLKLDKEYIATMKLGFVSSTGDTEGEICKFDSGVVRGDTDAFTDASIEVDTGEPDLSVVQETVKKFTGKIQQTVPKFSAVKIDGQRAYKLARKGVEFEAPTREIEVYEIQVLEYNYPDLVIRCKVSSGTYIRTLAEDIGAALGVGAYLTALRRTQVGKYRVEDATTLDEYSAFDD